MKANIIAIIIAVILIGGTIILTRNNSSSGSTTANVENAQNVSVVDGKQIIEIKAKGGYTPRVSNVKAGIPTILRFNTSGTFDCSASVRLPSLNIFKVLTNSGTTDIDLGTLKSGTIYGTCGMGMYPFEIRVQ